MLFKESSIRTLPPELQSFARTHNLNHKERASARKTKEIADKAFRGPNYKVNILPSNQADELLVTIGRVIWQEHDYIQETRGLLKKFHCIKG